MGTCVGSKRDGQQCTVIVEPPKTHCWWHDPAHASQRSRSASKAGKSKPNTELSNLKIKVEELADDVLQGKVEKGRAAVCNQLYNTLLRCIEIERRIRLVDDIESRLEALERRQAFRGGGNRW